MITLLHYHTFVIACVRLHNTLLNVLIYDTSGANICKCFTYHAQRLFQQLNQNVAFAFALFTDILLMLITLVMLITLIDLITIIIANHANHASNANPTNHANHANH